MEKGKYFVFPESVIKVFNFFKNFKKGFPFCRHARYFYYGVKALLFISFFIFFSSLFKTSSDVSFWNQFFIYSVFVTLLLLIRRFCVYVIFLLISFRFKVIYNLFCYYVNKVPYTFRYFY